MLGFLIGVSIAVFIVGAYLIIKNAKEKKEKKKRESQQDDDLPFTSFDDKPKEWFYMIRYLFRKELI